ncbi:hypothetical protein [Salinithrix halophila]|uniref:Stage II sporulation protein B n=1 Tax=Salinithrix halophila TaxID=1485204 RepID=A0ABV8JKR5_9BACL
MEKPRITVRLNGLATHPSQKIAGLSCNSKEKEGLETVAKPEGRERGTREPDRARTPWTVLEVDEEGIEWGSPYSRKRSTQGKKAVGALLLSIGAAVMIGTLMGVVVLSLFFPEGSDSSAGSIDSHLKTVPSEVEKEIAGKKKESKQEIPTVTIPKLTAVLVQGGTFQEKAGAGKTVMNQRTQGLAAVMTDKAPYRIYQGAALNKGEAQKLSAGFKEKKGEVYYKDIQLGKDVPLPKGAETAWKKDLPTALREGNRIFTTMAKLTVKGVSSPGTDLDFQSARKDVNQAYTRFSKVRDSVEKGLSDQTMADWIQMVRAMDLVVQSTQTEKPNKTVLWQIQEGLVRYALAYEKFIETLS